MNCRKDARASTSCKARIFIGLEVKEPNEIGLSNEVLRPAAVCESGGVVKDGNLEQSDSSREESWNL